MAYISTGTDTGSKIVFIDKCPSRQTKSQAPRSGSMVPPAKMSAYRIILNTWIVTFVASHVYV